MRSSFRSPEKIYQNNNYSHQKSNDVSFANLEHQNILRNSLSSIQRLRLSSPTYVNGNPITHEGKRESVERNH
jgi:hypothetical protein